MPPTHRSPGETGLLFLCTCVRTRLTAHRSPLIPQLEAVGLAPCETSSIHRGCIAENSAASGCIARQGSRSAQIAVSALRLQMRSAIFELCPSTVQLRER